MKLTKEQKRTFKDYIYGRHNFFFIRDFITDLIEKTKGRNQTKNIDLISDEVLTAQRHANEGRTKKALELLGVAMLHLENI